MHYALTRGKSVSTETTPASMAPALAAPAPDAPFEQNEHGSDILTDGDKQYAEIRFKGLARFHQTVADNYGKYISSDEYKGNKDSSTHVIEQEKDDKKGTSFREKFKNYIKGNTKEETNKETASKTDTGDLAQGTENTSDTTDSPAEIENKGKDLHTAEANIKDAINKCDKSDNKDGYLKRLLSLVSSVFTPIRDILHFVEVLTIIIKAIKETNDTKEFINWAKDKANINLSFKPHSTPSEKIQQALEALSGEFNWVSERLSLANNILALLKKAEHIPVLGAIVSGIDIVVNGIRMGLHIWAYMKAQKQKESMQKQHELLKTRMKEKYLIFSLSGNNQDVNMDKLQARRKVLENKEDRPKGSELTPNEMNELYDIRTYMLQLELERYK